MDFAPDPESAELAAGLRDLLATQLKGRALRYAIAQREVRDELWSALAEQGVPATLVAEQFDGLGLGWPAAVALLEEIGRSGAPGPLVDALAVAPDILGMLGDEFSAQLSQVAEGALKVGIADASDRVCGFDDLDAVLIATDAVGSSAAKIGLYPISEVSFANVPTLDEGVTVGRVTATGKADVLVALTDEVAARIEAGGMLATAAALVGVSRRMLSITTDYVAQRVAFGKIIGSYQAIQHPLVEVALKIEVAAPIVQAAAWALSHNRSDALERSAHAKLAAADAAGLAWRVCLQSHGAIGYTAEYDLQLWLKRSLTLTAQHGSAAVARRFLRDLLLDRIDLRDLDGATLPAPALDARTS